MRKGPTHKVAFVIGIILFIASPFLFFFAPRWLNPLFCTPDPQSYLPCANEFFLIGVTAVIVSLVVGVSLILWGLGNRKPFK